MQSETGPRASSGAQASDVMDPAVLMLVAVSATVLNVRRTKRCRGNGTRGRDRRRAHQTGHTEGVRHSEATTVTVLLTSFRITTLEAPGPRRMIRWSRRYLRPGASHRPRCRCDRRLLIQVRGTALVGGGVDSARDGIQSISAKLQRSADGRCAAG